MAWVFEQDLSAASVENDPYSQRYYAEAHRRLLARRDFYRRAFEARHFAHGNVGCLVDWLHGDVEATPEQLAASMFCCMPQALRKAYASRSRAGR